MLNSCLDQQAVDDDFNRMIIALVEIDLVFEIDQFAVDSRPGVSVLDERLHLFLELALASSDNWGHHHDPVLRTQGHNSLHDLVGRLPADCLSAPGAMRFAN